MPKDKPLKSAYELAMERLQAEDKAAGVQRKPLSSKAKKKIAELRKSARAKLAELEILHEKNRGPLVADPEKLAELERHYEIDRRRVESSLQESIAAVKNDEA